ncbi:MAG: phytanoyl-CoA dioxygenase family protein [Chitinophagaceae bacterium]|nr:phytanoyl-CoA dioxygenase family protein [Chitinophagaceae bacterium]
MRRVLIDNQLQKEFEEKGYVKIQLFSKDEINEFLSIHQSLHPDARFNTQEKNVKYHFSFLDTNLDYKQNVFNILSEKFQPKLDSVLDNYEPLVINFVQKEPGLGEVPVHQNWNFVDETKYTSVSVWTPLVDVAEINGTLEVIDGTHNTFRHVLRSPSIPWFFTGYENHLINNYCKPIEVKAGEVVIFDDSLIHYSKPNRGTYNRLVIQVIAKPKEVAAKHYYMNKKLFSYETEEMDVDKNFFLNFQYHLTEKPNGAIQTQKINYSKPKISKSDFDKIMMKLENA